MRRPWVYLLVLGLGAGTARAQQFSAVDAPVPYDGVVYAYETAVFSGAPRDYDTLDVSLPDAAELVAVEALPQGLPNAVLWDEASLTAQCGGGPPYACPGERSIPEPSTAATYTVQPTVVVGQHVLIIRREFGLPSASNAWPVSFRFVVRLAAGASCAQDPTATYTGPTGPATPFVALCASLAGLPTLSSVAGAPAVHTANRRAVPQQLSWDWQGETSNAATVTINGDVVLDCAPLGACTEAAVGQRLHLVDVRTFPAGVTYDVLDDLQPPPSNVVVQVRATHAGATTAAAATVTIEPLPVASLSVELAAPNNARRDLSGGDAVQLEVVSALNAYGGHEPPLVVYDVVAADLVPLATARTWLTAGGLLTLPVDVAASGTLTVEAVPTNPQNASVRASVVFNVAPGPPACVISAPQGSLPVQSRAVVALEAPSVGAAFAPSTILWRIVSGDAVITPNASDARQAEVRVGDTLGTVSIEATTSACRGGSALVHLDVQPTVRVTLRSERLRVAAGDPVLLTASIDNGGDAALAGLRLRWVLDAGLQPIAEGPKAAAHARTAQSWERRGAHREAIWEVDVTGRSHEELALPVIARALAGGGSLRARVELAYAPTLALSADAIAQADVALQILETPELSEPTLFGRVFVDANEDGIEQDDESGVSGAMVALAAGIYAVTDSLGRYHINGLSPGRHVAKVDGQSLPLGARPTTPWRRELTLTPGMFSRASFGVHVPQLGGGPSVRLVPQRSGIRVGGPTRVYVAALELAAERRLEAHASSGEVVVGRDAGGGVELALPLGEASREWLLVESDADGRHWLSRFGVYREVRPKGVVWIVPRGPMPLVGLLLPGDGEAVSRTGLAVMYRAYGNTTLELAWDEAAPACQLQLDGSTPAGEQRCSLGPPHQARALAIRVDPDVDDLGLDPPTVALRVPVPVGATAQFFVGRAQARGVRAPGGDDPARPWDADGAFFYRATYASGWHLTAGADVRASDVLYGPEGGLRSGGGVLARLLRHDPQRVFRDLDPEDYYPTYGDEARVVDEREAGGRLFARLESDSGYVKWGGINTAIDDAEMGRYVRSLYGLGAQVALGDAARTPTVRAVAFAARPTSAAARDELPVTGGSLYFLSHRDVVQGSLRVNLEVLDEISGLPVRAVALTEGLDYEADYLGGRIVLEAGTAARVIGQSLTQPGGTGHAGALILDYEYVPGGTLAQDWTLGARLVGGLGPATVGVTAVGELGGAAFDGGTLDRRYTLLGATGKVALGEALRLRLELARSEGGGFASARSNDGGLTYDVLPARDDRAGNAMLVELATAHAATELSVYGRRIERGFTDARTADGVRRLQGGLRF